MEYQQRQLEDQTIRNHQVTLLELLDRLIDKGVVVKGEILLSVADVDLVYLNLALLLSAVKTVEHAVRRGDRRERGISAKERSAPQEILDKQQSVVQSNNAPKHKKEAEASYERNRSAHRNAGNTGKNHRTSRLASDDKPQRRAGSGINVDPEHVEKGLVALVLTLVDLIRQLMEKQAIRRVEDDQLTETEIERVGNAFFLLDEKIAELKKAFDLTDEDINLNLGPLGDLL